MNTTLTTIPLVDLSEQHQPLQNQIDAAVRDVLQRGDFILGKDLAEFEAAFALKSGVSYGIGTGCGTDAISLGLQACGIGANDEVILPTNAFIATLIGVIRAGAKPILVDCDLDVRGVVRVARPEYIEATALIDLEAAAKAITTKTKAIVPLHLYGQMVSPRQLLDFASAYNVLIFEDAAQAHLAQREGYTAGGAGGVGIAAAYSLYPSKNLGSCGDGGMVLTNNAEVAQKVRSLRNYGAPRKYYHTEFGINSRLDNLQAAILNVLRLTSQI
ncbi:MAG: DegT/DnrJ/EryC1/StrS aminotransferase family protein [Hormoscilla sp. GM102CHS1]|nr:DegT/DnrJ/EryC1/StrS aminotransferase family protein [Hormoscilla sp. GM102CHS1]